MRTHSIAFGVCVSSLLIGLLTQSPDLITLAQGGSETGSSDTSSTQKQSESNPCDKAREITVKVLAGGSWGSGILVQKQGKRYTVLTNAHVLIGNSYQIQTSDGERYPAKRLVEFDDNNTSGDDLAILQFDSPEEYDRAILAPKASLRERQKVFAAGFPVNTTPYQNIEATGGIVCLWPGGIISLILDRPMQEGYQIGYHIDIAQGMSGGPLLNEKGEVIGVNGKGDPLIFRNPDIYRYQDDNSRVQQPLNVMTSSSWAIPIETFVQQAPASLQYTPGQLANIPRDRARQTRTPAQQQSSPNEGVTEQNRSSQGRTDNHQASPNPPTQAANPQSPPNEGVTAQNRSSEERTDNHQASPNPPTQAANPPTHVPRKLEESEIRNRAEKITVLVSYSHKSSPDKIIPLGAGVLIAKQGTTYYALTHESVIPPSYYKNQDSRFSIGDNQPRYEVNHIGRANTGLVLLKFTSNHNEEVARVGDAKNLEENSPVYIAGWKMGQDPSWKFQFTKAEKISQINFNTDYIVADNNKTRGMKGGPVFDENGMLVAIHHKGEKGKDEGISIPDIQSLFLQPPQPTPSQPTSTSTNSIQPYPDGPPLPRCSETLWGNCL